jgi:thioredoxin 1
MRKDPVVLAGWTAAAIVALWFVLDLFALAPFGVRSAGFGVQGVRPAALAKALDEPGAPVVVMFSESFCVACRGFTPTYRRVAQEFHGRARFLKVDLTVDDAEEWRVFAVPTVRVYRGGRPVDERVGALPAESLRSVVTRAIESR